MSQPSPSEKTSLPPAETPSKKEQDDKSKLSNGVWESIKQDYVKPLSWVEGNVVAPLYNEAIVKPVNTVIDKAQKLHVPISKLQTAAVPEAGIDSPGFYAQQMASTAGNLAWMVGAGAVAGKYLRAGGEALALKAEASGFKIETAQSIRNFAARREVANITGAALYGAAIDPETGQSRTGNAFSAAEGMLLFEGANKFVGSTKFLDARAIGLRAATGAPIGVSQQLFSSWIATGNVDVSPEHYTKAAVSGAFMNTMLPGAMKLPELIAPKLGINAYADRFAEQQHQSALASLKLDAPAEPGSWAAPKAAGLAISAGRMDITAKARSSATEETNINHVTGLLTLKHGDSPSQFVEENAHIRIARDPKFEEGFVKASESLKAGRTDEGRQEYINARMAQEVAAHTARFEAIQKSGATNESTSINPLEIAKEYAGKFAMEAKAFMASNGQFRPEMSFSHGGGSVHTGSDGVHFTQNVDVGIGPGVSHDGLPHTPGDTRTSLDGAATANQIASVDRSSLLNDIPKNAKSFIPKPGSGESFVYTWPDRPSGVSFLGHDNIRSVSFKSLDLPEIVLIKVDPITLEDASWVRNYAKGQEYRQAVDGSNNDGSKKDGSVRFTFHEWEQNLHTAHSIYKIDKPASWAMPEKSTWETYPHRIQLELGGQPVWISSILRHNDASNRIDYRVSDTSASLTELVNPLAIGDIPAQGWKPGDPVGLDKDGKPNYFLGQRLQEHADGSSTNYVFDPRKLDPTFPRDQLEPDSSIDVFTAERPLTTSIGNFDNVHRMSDQLRYESDNETKVVHFGGDKLEVVTNKVGESPEVQKVDSIVEEYSNGRDTLWGKATKLEIKPKSMIATLEDGGTVEVFNSQAYPDGVPTRFGNVRRVDTAPPTRDASGNPVDGVITLFKEIKASQGLEYSKVIVPPKPLAVPGLSVFKADAFEEFPGSTNQITFHLSDGGEEGKKIPYGTIETKADHYKVSEDSSLKDGPYHAVWRQPSGVVYLQNVDNGASNWTKSSIVFGNPETGHNARLILNKDFFEPESKAEIRHFAGDDIWSNHEGTPMPKPLLTEDYPNGHTTPWGNASNRAIYFDGSALMKMQDASTIHVDQNGNFVQRFPAPLDAQ